MRDLQHMLTLITATLLTAWGAFAADVRMSVQPELISLLDRAVLKVEFIDCSGDAVDFPNIDGLDIEYRGKSSETSIINMKSSSKVVHTYLITPSKVGDFTIGPVTVKYKGGEKTLSVNLRVIKPQDDQEAQQLSEMLFSTISSDREAPYVHEPFDLELNVFVRDGVQIDGQFGIRGGLPESGLDGELQWQVAGRTRKERNGVIFNVYTLRTTAKTLTAGKFRFNPRVELNVVIPRQQRRPWGFDDPFFGDLFGRQETRPIVLDCNTLDIDVQPVPIKGRPVSFTGGVGLLDFNVSIGPTQVMAGDPVTVKMRISGKGNLEKITPPEIQDNHDVKIYDVRTVPTENPNEVRFEQVIIPTSDEVKEIPAISFSYFNTQTADFRTITKGPFPINVQAVPQRAAQVIATVPSTIQQETKVLGRDIAYLKPQPRTWKMKGETAWYGTTYFKTLLALPALVLVLSAGMATRRNALAKNVALARRQKAPKAARRNVHRAEKAMRKKDANAFYEAMWNALEEYFGHRLNLAPGDVTLGTVLGRIKGEPDAIKELFNTIEQRRYAIQSGDGNPQTEMKALLRKFTATLRKCERMKL